MSKRMIDVLFREGALELDRRDNSLHPWSINALRDGGAAGSGQRLFDQAETLVVDNVTRYLYEVCEQEVWGGDDFPNCAPPFPTFWMETRAPAYMRSGKTVRPWEGQHAWGALFIASEFPQGLQQALHTGVSAESLQDHRQAQWAKVLRVFAHHGRRFPTSPPLSEERGRAWFAGLPDDCRQVLYEYVALERSFEGLSTLGGLVLEDVRWHYTIIPFMQLHAHAGVSGPLMYGTALVSSTGQLLGLPSTSADCQYVLWSMAFGECVEAEQRTQFAAFANTLVMPMWLALSFMHCKNVSLTKEDPCHSRKPPKKGDVCRRLHYHVLNIQPMQDVLRREGHSHTTGLKQALHICRGHFKDYRQRGLFGKYQGLFWWDAHIRGTGKEGVVIKDYNVQSAAQEVAYV